LETYYKKFLEKQNACLFATDIAARGLDFPNVDWILQFDCPENVDQYIHRCGRTARYRSNGNALLFLLPSEKKFLDQLENSKITVKFSKISPSMLKQSLQGHMSSCVASSPEIKFLGQKAFITYMRSVFLQGNKEVFDVHALPAAELAKSMGLPGTPRINFIKAIKIPKNSIKRFDDFEDDEKNEENEENENQIENDDDKDKDNSTSSKNSHYVSTKEKDQVNALLKRKNRTVFSDTYKKLLETEDGDDDEFLTKKKNNDRFDKIGIDEERDKNFENDQIDFNTKENKEENEKKERRKKYYSKSKKKKSNFNH